MTDYSEQLTSGIATYGLTGASFAYWDGQALHRAVAGVRNSVTGDPITFDTVMHIGSITKVVNAALLLQLVDEGKVSLKDHVVSHLPRLRLLDERALEGITCEMLLNHTSGINGDWLPDRGPDRERIVDVVNRSAELGQLFGPGENTSYCNIATVIAGHLTEVLRGESWYTVVKRKIFEPLRMHHALADVTDAPRFRCSIGDLTNLETGTNIQTTRPFLSPGFAPAGSTVMMSATDLVTFARSLIDMRTGSERVRLLSEETASRMREPTGAFTSPACGAGLGWIVMPRGVLTHGGVGPGVYSVLYAHPESGRVASLLTNNDRGKMLEPIVMEPILESWTGGRSAVSEVDPAEFDVSSYAGVYESNLQRIEVFSSGGGLVMQVSLKMNLYDNSPYGSSRAKPLSRLSHLGKHTFIGEPLLPRGPRPEVRFLGRDDVGHMRFLGTNYRLLARSESNQEATAQ